MISNYALETQRRASTDVKKIGNFKMKLVSCLQLFFLLEMFNAKRTTNKSKPKEGVSIPLQFTPSNTGNTGPRSARRYYNMSDNWGEGVHLTNISVFAIPTTRLKLIFDTTINISWAYWKDYDPCDENAEDVKNKHVLINPWETQPTDEADFFYTRGGWILGFTTQIPLVFPDVSQAEPNFHFSLTFLKVMKASKNLIDQPFDAVIGIGPQSDIFRVCDAWKQPRAISIVLPPLRLAQSSLKGELVLCGTKPNIRKLAWPETPISISYVVYTPYWATVFYKLVMDKFAGDGNKGAHEVATIVVIMFDVNTPYLFMPKSYLDFYKTLANITEDPITNELKVSCTNTGLLPAIGFHDKSGTEFYLMGDEYTLHKRLPDNSEECQVLFRQHDETHITMGDLFMRKYFTVFYDNPKAIKVSGYQ